ncbi:hypothetical protein D3C81_1001930 [compost metagenome]
MRSRLSEITPPNTPPMKPQMAGREATKPAFRIDMPRACTRYTGNQVRKKYVSTLMQYWPRYTPASMRLESSCLA